MRRAIINGITTALWILSWVLVAGCGGDGGDVPANVPAALPEGSTIQCDESGNPIQCEEGACVPLETVADAVEGRRYQAKIGDIYLEGPVQCGAVIVITESVADTDTNATANVGQR